MRFDWRINDAELLERRFCDLPLSIDAPFIQRHVQRLYAELDARGICFKPHVWLADEWFSADGVPGFAIPFYLAHPRLMRLERKLLHEVEGGNSNWMMRILRHEAGHAIDTAYRIRRRKDWRQIFGRASLPYPTRYRPDTASHAYVQHLGSWYAQSHPTEDFAESFAVWLQPGSRWRRHYAHWPQVLAKLEYVDGLMRELRDAKPKVFSRAVIEPLSKNKRTLAAHYKREAEKYSIERTRRFDALLHRLFKTRGEGPAARRLLLRSRRDVLAAIHAHPDARPYTVYNVVRLLTERCHELGLAAPSARIAASSEYRLRVARAVTRLALEHCKIDSAHRRRQQYAL
jgi:hypothetical protein